MNAAHPNPTNPIQQVLYSFAKSINNALDPAPPPGTPTVGTPNLNTGAVTGTLGFPTGSGLTYTVALPANGALTLSGDGSYTYTPSQTARQAAAANSTDSFTVTVQNGLSSSSVTVTVPIDPGTPIAGTPILGTPNVSTGKLFGNAIFTDTAGRTLTYSTSATSTGGGTVTLDTTSGDFTYTPTEAQRQAAGLDTTDTITITSSNGVRSATQTITVPIDGGIPIAGTPTVGTPETSNGAVYGRVKFTDPHGRKLTYSTFGSSSAGGGNVTVNATTGDFIYTPTRAQRRAAGLNTTDTFTITATNSVGSTTETITVTVDPGTPAASEPPANTFDGSNGAVKGAVAFSDTAGRALTYSTAGSSTGGGTVTIDASTGAFVYTPTTTQRENTAATDTFTVTISNGVRTTTKTVTVPILSSAVVATIPVGHGSATLALSANGATLYVVNTSDKTVSVIDTATKAVVATIGVGSTPFQIALAPNGFAYVTTSDDNWVTVIDTATNTVKATIWVAGASYGLAIDPSSGLAYAAQLSQNRVRLFNIATNTLTTTISLNGPVTVALSPNGTLLYAATWEVSTSGVSVINTATRSVVATIPLSSRPLFLAVSPDGSMIYVTNSTTGTGDAIEPGNTVSVISTATNTVTATITVGDYPSDVAFSPDGKFAYVTNAYSGTVSVIDTATNTVTHTISAAMSPGFVTVSPDGHTAYVTDSVSNMISVIDLSALSAAVD
ncbi:VCBS domain-containing protein [Mycolicibacterium sp. Dal123E01]|uniref:VCBS domain-containing protein n=1 Tax=Mycolicibacterium sp. Dal123E01 TaxID=3457578 RepID=UPI00403EDB4A